MEAKEEDHYGIPKDTLAQCSSLIFLLGLEPAANANHAIIWEVLSKHSKPALQTPATFKLTSLNEFSLPQMKPRRQSYEWYTPKGVLKSNWMSKYLYEVPALIAIFFTLDWSDSNWLIRKNELASIISSVKEVIGERSCRVAVILLQSSTGSPATDSSSPCAPFSESETNASLSGERASILCESCDLPTKHLFVLPLSDAQLIPGYTTRLEAALTDIAGGFYLSESKTVRGHRDFLNKTNHQLLFVRHCYKTGFLLEMKGDLQGAIKCYQQSYQHLSELRFTDTNLHEIRISAAIINYKVCRVNFLLNLPRDAIAQFRRHIDLFRPRMGPKPLLFEHYAWLACQYELFGYLFESAVLQGLPAVQTQHPGFYYQQAAQFASLRRTTALHLCSGATGNHQHLLDGLESLEIYGQRPWRAGKHSLEPPESEREACGIEAVQYHELTKVKHHDLIIPLYSQAVAQFQRYRCPRIKQQLMVQMATEYQKAAQHQKALAVAQHVLHQYRSERWWPLVTHCSLLSLQCAAAVADVPAYVAAALEIAGPKVALARALKLRVFSDGLCNVLKGVPPASTVDAVAATPAWIAALQQCSSPVEVDMSTLVACLEVRATFDTATASAFSKCNVSVHIRNNFLELIRVRDISVILEPNVAGKLQEQQQSQAASPVVLTKDGYEDLASGAVQEVVLPFTPQFLPAPHDGFKIRCVECSMDGSAGGGGGGPQTRGLTARLRWTGAGNGGVAALAALTPHHPEFFVLRCPSFDTLVPKTLLRVVSPTPLLHVQVKHDARALVWEWLEAEVVITNQEDRPLTDLQLSLALQQPAPPALEQTTHISSSTSAAPSESCGSSVQGALVTSSLQPGAVVHHRLLIRSLTAAVRTFTLTVQCNKTVEGEAGQLVQCGAVHTSPLTVTAAVPFHVDVSCESLQTPAQPQQQQGSTVRVNQPFLVTARVSCSSHVPVTLHSSKLVLSTGVESCSSGGGNSCNGCISACSISAGETASDCFCVQVTACSAPQLQLGHFLLHWSRRGAACEEEQKPRPVTMTVALPTVSVWSESVLVEGSAPAHCSLHCPAPLRYCVTNHSLHSLECVITIEQSQCFMLAGNQQIRVRLLSQQEQQLQYLLYPVTCGTLPLPRVSVSVEAKPSAAGRLLMQPVTVVYSRTLPSHLLVKPQELPLLPSTRASMPATQAV